MHSIQPTFYYTQIFNVHNINNSYMGSGIKFENFIANLHRSLFYFQVSGFQIVTSE